MNIDNTVNKADIFALCSIIPDSSIDMIFADLPYGTTQCKWDIIIPFEPMWKEFHRIIKPKGIMVFTAAEPFKSMLIMSNQKYFRYDLVWDKVAPTGHLNANRMPMRRHEHIAVFYKRLGTYNKQYRTGKPNKARALATSNGVGENGTTEVYGKFKQTKWENDGTKYNPTSIIQITNDKNEKRYHPTQKPVSLLEYLIKQYTNEGDLVFDPVCGSGTTAVAAKALNRRFIVGDKEQKYVDITLERLNGF